MQEFNKRTLDKALDKLRVHLPDEEVWDSIEETLDLDEAIEGNLPKLNNYSPPALVWDNISEQLEEETKVKKLTWFKPLLAAASVALVFFLFTFGNNATLNAGNVVEEYSVQQYPRTMFHRTNYNNGYASNAITALVNAQKISKDDNEEVLTELRELEEAAQKLSAAMGTYDTNQDLKSKLDAIEKERNELMNELLTEIKI